jgi:hypothetical protein
VDEKVLRQLIDAAIQAPSAVNQQPWLLWSSGTKHYSRAFRAKAHMLKTSAAALASHHFQSILENPDSTYSITLQHWS